MESTFATVSPPRLTLNLRPRRQDARLQEVGGVAVAKHRKMGAVVEHRQRWSPLGQQLGFLQMWETVMPATPQVRGFLT